MEIFEPLMGRQTNVRGHRIENQINQSNLCFFSLKVEVRRTILSLVKLLIMETIS